MIDNLFTHFIALFCGVLIGFKVAAIAAENTWSKPEAHHRDAYDAHGNLTCEFCKELIKKGNINGK